MPTGITEEDYVSVQSKLETIDIFARLTNHGVFVADLFRNNFLYVSDNPLVLLGCSKEEVLARGYRHLIDNAPDSEKQVMAELVTASLNAHHNMKAEERQSHTISCNFHFMLDGRPVLVNHKISPLATDARGIVWLALCVVSPSVHDDIGHITATVEGKDGYSQYSLDEHCWIRNNRLAVLTSEERMMLYLSAQGCSMREIGERMFRSTDTVKMYRKHLFAKLGVSNITEALNYAFNYNLL